MAELCELVHDGPEGPSLRVLWESLIPCMGYELRGSVGGHVWPPRAIELASGWLSIKDVLPVLVMI